MRINGFEQIKSFYSWVFSNPDKVRPVHVSLYVFLINQNNRNNWVEWFKCPFDLAMQGACIGSKSTYYSALKDLNEWRLLDYKEGVNNSKAPLIRLIVLSKSEPQTIPQSEPQSGQLTEPLTEPLSGLVSGKIYKLITSNLQLVTDNLFKWIENEKSILTVDERKAKFIDSIAPFTQTYGKEMCRAFFEHWSELNKSGSKMKFEIEKTWEIDKRLKKWFDNSKKFNNGKQTRKTGHDFDEVRSVAQRILRGEL